MTQNSLLLTRTQRARHRHAYVTVRKCVLSATYRTRSYHTRADSANQQIAKTLRTYLQPKADLANPSAPPKPTADPSSLEQTLQIQRKHFKENPVQTLQTSAHLKSTSKSQKTPEQPCTSRAEALMILQHKTMLFKPKQTLATKQA